MQPGPINMKEGWGAFPPDRRGVGECTQGRVMEAACRAGIYACRACILTSANADATPSMTVSTNSSIQMPRDMPWVVMDTTRTSAMATASSKSSSVCSATSLAVVLHPSHTSASETAVT